jgi:hypothetical protein
MLHFPAQQWSGSWAGVMARNAWLLVDVLEMNFENDLESALDFFFVESRFYPDLGRLCIQRVIESFPAKKDEHATG